MTAKPAVIAVLSGLCFVPAGILALTTRVRPVAYRAVSPTDTDVGRITPSARARAPVVELQPVIVAAERRTPGRADAVPTNGPCADWRPIAAGPNARAADRGAVRVCEGVPAASEPRPSMVRQHPRTPTPSAPLEFTVDLRTP
jgi:hypothetical protein